jgi:hypothetical protein
MSSSSCPRLMPPAMTGSTPLLSGTSEINAAAEWRARDRHLLPRQLSLGGRPRVDTAAPDLEAMVSLTAGEAAVTSARSSHRGRGLAVLERPELDGGLNLWAFFWILLYGYWQFLLNLEEFFISVYVYNAKDLGNFCWMLGNVFYWMWGISKIVLQSC